MNSKYILIILLFLILNSCQKNKQIKYNSENNQSYVMSESYYEDDDFYFEAYEEKIKFAKENFKKLNSIPKNEWTSIIQKDLYESTEGGKAIFYFMENELKKIIIRNFGEIGQSLDEYYLHDNKISFVYNKTLEYNRPIYYDSTMMKENNDNEAFDINKSRQYYIKNYFQNGKLIYLYDNYEPESLVTPSEEYIKNYENEIFKNYNSLLKYLN